MRDGGARIRHEANPRGLSCSVRSCWAACGADRREDEKRTPAQRVIRGDGSHPLAARIRRSIPWHAENEGHGLRSSQNMGLERQYGEWQRHSTMRTRGSTTMRTAVRRKCCGFYKQLATGTIIPASRTLGSTASCRPFSLAHTALMCLISDWAKLVGAGQGETTA